MTERSFYWEGQTTGDGTLAPYGSGIYSNVWKLLFSKNNNQGVIEDYLNELVVSGVSTSVSINTGAAIVIGTFYENSTVLSISIPTPVTDPRIDRIVLQRDLLAQTIRIARVPGTENASPTAPALTQIVNEIWEIPLAQALVTTVGAITVTDEKEFARTPLASSPSGATVEIETITSDGSLVRMDFLDIPQIYKHLFIVGQLLVTPTSGGTTVGILFNGDSLKANYAGQALNGTSSTVLASGASGITPGVDTRATLISSNERGTQFSIYVSNYTNTTFYKTWIKEEITIENNTTSNWGQKISTVLWENTVAINRITMLPLLASVLKVGSQVTLYGMR